MSYFLSIEQSGAGGSGMVARHTWPTHPGSSEPKVKLI